MTTLKKKEGTLKLMEFTCKENKCEKKMQEKARHIKSRRALSFVASNIFYSYATSYVPRHETLSA